MQEKILKLTNAAYKIIDFFPEADPIKNRARDRALAIMENLVFLSGVDGWASLQNEKIKTQVSDDIDVLLGYFWIAKAQSWMSNINYFIICNEYEKIRKEFHPYIELTKKMPFDSLPDNPPEISVDKVKIESSEMKVEKIEKKKEAKKQIVKKPQKGELGERQKKIVDFLNNNEKAQVMDLQKVLGNITKRTIRRDLDELLESGVVKRMGEFNSVFYVLGQNRTKSS